MQNKLQRAAAEAAGKGRLKIRFRQASSGKKDS